MKTVSSLESSAQAFRRATLLDVARAAGVSHMTVSRFQRSPDLLTEGTRKRVADAVAKLGYVPNQAAVGLVSDRSRVVVVLLPNISVPLYHGIFVSLSDALQRAGYKALVAETAQDMQREEDLLRSLLGWNPSAVVMIGRGHSKGLRQLIEYTALACCELLEISGESTALSVGYSNHALGKCVAEHLLVSGRREIAFVRYAGLWSDRLKLQRDGAQTAVASVQGARLRTLVLKATYPLTMAAGAEAIDMALAGPVPADALMFSSDVPASGALLECARLGIRVPEDLAITGFGDYELGRFLQPSLTTVRVDTRAIGERAGEALLARLRGESAPATQDLGFELVRRGSSEAAGGKRRSVRLPVS